MAKRGYESQKTGQKVDELLDKIDNLNVPEWALQESKPSYTAQEVHALPENTSIPRKTSDLVNDKGFITQESDPTVPSWAKQPSKPTYTAEEVGALPDTTPIPVVPENVSAFNNDAGYLTQHQDISGKEDKSNKVTSLSVQNTDTQYPSAKAVFDNLSTKQDTINDLGSIRSGASAGATAYQKPQAGIPESDLSQGVKDSLDAKAGIGDVLFANFSNLTPKKTFEYDVSDTAYHPLFSRANTGISQLMSEVDDIVKFRITVTGTNIYARVDVVVRFQPALTDPCMMIWNENSNSGNNMGLYRFRIIRPKALNSDYAWFVEFNNYTATTRHIKVEVYEYTENISWVETHEGSSYNSGVQNESTIDVMTYRGLIANQQWKLFGGYALTSASAQYISNSLSAWLGGTLPLVGEPLYVNQLVILSEQKLYKATNKNVPIDCDCGVVGIVGGIGGSYAAGSTPQYYTLRQKQSWTNLTGDPALTMDTFARGDQVYLRCTLGQDGKIYPDGHLSNVKSAGYTWVHIGTAASATAINLDTCGKPFITLNNDGKVTHINGTAVMDSSMAKWGVVSQTQTWTQASDGGYDYTMSDLQYGWIPQANIDLYEAAGAVFNEQSGYFELNGLEDISYEEMGRIYRRGSLPQSPYAWTIWAQGAEERTFLPIITIRESYNEGRGGFTKFANSSKFEVCTFARNKNGINNLEVGAINYAFYTCRYLKKIGNLLLTNTSTSAFTSCYSLETAYLYGIVNSIEFRQSPRLSVESILYMIQNEASTSAITITLHPTAYARAIADSDVQAALQAHTNVSLASAT